MPNVLAAATALMLVAGMLQFQESRGGLPAGAQDSIVDRVMEFRPQGPPPAFDVDQLTPEEMEQPVPATPAAGSSEISGRDSGNLRSRPER